MAIPPALFIAAHPDDEVLAMGVAIAEHVAAGRIVHLLWLTDGGTTNARNFINGAGVNGWWGVAHDPYAEGYLPLSVADCAAARIREGLNAVRQLATGYGDVTVHRAHLQDGLFSQAEAEAAIRAVADLVAFGQPVHLKGHSFVDNHPDHLAAAHAIQGLVLDEPARFADPRFYVLPTYWSDSRLSQVADQFDNPTNPGVAARVRNACRAYAAWAPPQTYAVGMHSVAGLFDTVAAQPRCLYHP